MLYYRGQYLLCLKNYGLASFCIRQVAEMGQGTVFFSVSAQINFEIIKDVYYFCIVFQKWFVLFHFIVHAFLFCFRNTFLASTSCLPFSYSENLRDYMLCQLSGRQEKAGLFSGGM